MFHHTDPTHAQPDWDHDDGPAVARSFGKINSSPLIDEITLMAPIGAAIDGLVNAPLETAWNAAGTDTSIPPGVARGANTDLLKTERVL